jgi:magnesium transporter
MSERDHAAEHPWERLAELARAPDPADLERYLASLPGAELARAFSRLSSDDQSAILSSIGPELAAEVIEEFPNVQAARALERLEPDSAAPILAELRSDDRVDVLSHVDEHRAEAILGETAPETARSIRQLLRYDPLSAGGLMITEYVLVSQEDRVADVIDVLRRNVDRYADYQVQYVYVAGEGERLVGVLRLRDLLLARGDSPVPQLMIREPVRVHQATGLEDLSALFDAHPFVGIPVVDDADHVMGVVLRERVRRAEIEHSEKSRMRSSGIVSGDELRSMPLLLRSRRRLSWLSLNIVLNVVSASVIALYQETLESAIALAVFLPIISDMSGCSGNQAVAVSMRELSLGLVRPFEALRVWGKEISVGVLNGAALGLLIALLALVWKGNPFLGVVVGTALALNTMVAVSIGGTIPLLLKRAGFDPALASGPVLTTVTDMCGFFLVLSLATAWLPRLVP